VGQGFSVDASRLAAGSQDLAVLQGRCEDVARDAITALEGMAGSAGHAGLSSELAGAAGNGAKKFEQISAAFGHVGDALSASAAKYKATERGLTARAKGILPW
jgi:hypothetical protein